jgi:DNA primase
MISPKTIAAIRDRVEISQIVSETVKLKRQGRSLVGLCPFHKEKTPSFSVNPEKGFFYCFGCKEKGNVFDFLMKVEGLSFPEAARRLADGAGIEVEETTSDFERREADAARRAVDDLFAVNQLAAHWFERQLREHPQSTIAWHELARRGLLDEKSRDPEPLVRDALQAFRIGYAPASWDGLTQFLAQQGVSPVTATKVGLIAPRKSGSGHYDWFRHRLMFTILDVQGRVIGFSGRVLADPETGVVDKQSPKYINSPESAVYQKGQTLFGLYQARQSIRQEEEAVLVEGNFDVFSLHARGISNVVAPLGTAFTAVQGKLLRRYTPTVTLLFDGDAAGKKATNEAHATCKASGLLAKVAVLPGAKDPDDFVRERGPEALRAAVRAARDILEHRIEAALDEAFVRGDAHERGARVREVVTLIASEDDPTVRAMAQTYADNIAQRIGLPDAASFRQLQSAVSRALAQATHPASTLPQGTNRAGPAPSGGALSSPNAVGLAILGCFLDFPDLLDDPAGQDAIRELEGDAALGVAAIANAQKAGQEAGQKFGQDGIEILAHLPATIHTFAAQRLASPRHEHREDARYELVWNAQKLKQQGLSKHETQVIEALHRIDRTGDQGAADALLREMVSRAREKRGIKEG